jgi:hypothetical protein
LGITPTFKGGLIIDHEAFPLNTLLQWFLNIIQKFCIDGERGKLSILHILN